MSSAGLATGLSTLASLRPVAGVQLKISAFFADAVRVIGLFSNMLCLVCVMATGGGSTLTIREAVSVQPLLLVIITLYRVVSAGEATGVAMVLSDKPFPGIHL